MFKYYKNAFLLTLKSEMWEWGPSYWAENIEVKNEKLNPWVKWQLSSLKDEINLNDWINKTEVISILNDFKDSNFSKNGQTPLNSAQAILAIQSGLKMLNKEPGTIDALFWNKTKWAIIDFQTEWNENNPNDIITIDGIPWSQTISKLINVLNNNAETNAETDTDYDTKTETNAGTVDTGASANIPSISTDIPL